MNGFFVCFLLLYKIKFVAPAIESFEDFQIVEQCEFGSFQLAVELSDHFNRHNFRKSNKVKDVHDTIQSFRLHQDFITEHLGFMSTSMSAGYNNTGLTLTNSSSSLLRTKGGWDNGSHSPSYRPLHDKYMYLVGDSTIRQIFGLFGSITRGENFGKNAKDWSRSQCRTQYPQRVVGSKNHCGKNEVKCDIEGLGPEGRIVYDWKHFVFEDYDKWLWGGTGPWHIDRTRPRPEILILQTGLHACSHESESPHSKGEANYDKIYEAVPILMSSVKRAVQRVEYKNGQFKPPTTVIIMTSGRRFSGGDNCILTLNRLIVAAAHEQGFYVLEREEIERRAIHKSEYVNSSFEIPPFEVDFHLPTPIPEIISTAILKIISCSTEQSKGRLEKILMEDSVTDNQSKKNMTETAIILKGILLDGKIIRSKNRVETVIISGNESRSKSGRTDLGIGNDSLENLEFPLYVVDVVGFRRLIHDPNCTKLMQLHSREIITLDEEDFDSIPLGDDLDVNLCKEGSLHRVDQEKVITVISNNSRRSIANMDVFIAHNFQTENIKVIKKGDAYLMPMGEPLNIGTP